MPTALPTLTPLEDSLFLTLCGRALDYRTPRPVLGDAMAPEVAQFPPLLRAYYRLSARSTSWSRKGTVVLHYRF